MVILCGDWTVDSLTPGVAGWLSELPGDWDSYGQLPPSVLAVASKALQIAEQEAPAGEVAMARVMTRTGQWIALHGAALSGKSAGKTAVILESAHPARIVPILMAVYGLTQREQEVARRVLFGDSTSQIAGTLRMAPHTVQEHLKRIFEKTGVHTRRELVGKVFINHYDPRLRDNERRWHNDAPIRGGPVRASQPSPPDKNSHLQS